MATSLENAIKDLVINSRRLPDESHRQWTSTGCHFIFDMGYTVRR